MEEANLMTEPLTAAELVEVLRVDQCRQWKQGKRVPAEAYLTQHPVLQTDTDGVLKLVYQEVLLREQHGETPRLEEYLELSCRVAAP
jgi:hypothetical protein